MLATRVLMPSAVRATRLLMPSAVRAAQLSVPTSMRFCSSAAASAHSTGPLQAYRNASRAAPMTTAFLTCLIKGSASDGVAQLQVERKESMDWKRNCAFALFSAAHLGIGQHIIYNVWFTRWFGKGTDFLTGMKKVVADSTWHVPLVYLPLYYPFKTVALGEGTASDGLRQYSRDALEVLTTYWSMWPAVHLISFTVMPQELRIAFVASASFVWLVYLSNASHREDFEPQHPDGGV